MRVDHCSRKADCDGKKGNVVTKGRLWFCLVLFFNRISKSLKKTNQVGSEAKHFTQRRENQQCRFLKQQEWETFKHRQRHWPQVAGGECFFNCNRKRGNRTGADIGRFFLFENEEMPLKCLNISFIKQIVRLFAKVIKKGKGERRVRCLRRGQTVSTVIIKGKKLTRDIVFTEQQYQGPI